MSQIKREKTADLDSPEVWGKLTPLTPGLPTHQLTEDIISIGRLKDCTIQINDKRLSGKHCHIEKRGDELFVKDLSTNGTYVKDVKIGKNKELKIQNETEIWLLPASKVKPSETLGFRVDLTAAKKEEEEVKGKRTKEEEEALEKKREEEEKERELEKEKAEKERQEREKEREKEKQIKAKNDNFSQSIKDQITCAFCFEIMHGPVNVQPCNHRFCGGCLAELINNKKGDCIQCRKQILTAVKDSSFNSIIDDYLKSHPEDKRDQAEIDELDKKNFFTFDPVDIVARITGKPAKKAVTAPTAARGRGRRAPIRASSDLSASDDEDTAVRCRQCMNERDGFRCTASQKHTRCFTCGKMMADRAQKELHQYCVLCTQYFCNIYYPPCGRGVHLHLLKDQRNNCKLDTEVMRGNRTEFEILRNYLVSKKMTSKEMFDEVMKQVDKKEFSYIIDRKIMKAPPTVSREVKMEGDDAVCDLCWKDLWFQMVFSYRTKIQPDLPPPVRDRPVCYWGINCRSADHNVDHAKRFNHVVFQTRF